MASSTLHIVVANEINKDIEKYKSKLLIGTIAPYIPDFKPIIKEIPMDKLYLIVNKTSEIIENTKINKDMMFDMSNVEKFIELILGNLKELGIYD